MYGVVCIIVVKVKSHPKLASPHFLHHKCLTLFVSPYQARLTTLKLLFCDLISGFSLGVGPSGSIPVFHSFQPWYVTPLHGFGLGWARIRLLIPSRLLHFKEYTTWYIYNSTD